MFPRNEDRNEGTLGCSPGTKTRTRPFFACSPGTKTGTRVHSPKPPFWKTDPFVCDPSRHVQEFPGPPGPKLQKSLEKGLSGGLQKSLQKYPKKSKNTDFRTFLSIFRLFRVFLGTFLQTPEKTFFETFCDFGPGGPGNPCKWRLGSQPFVNPRILIFQGFWAFWRVRCVTRFALHIAKLEAINHARRVGASTSIPRRRSLVPR